MNNNEPPIFLTTYEPDRFGEQALRLVESLRRNGGSLSKAVFMLAHTRRGPQIPKNHKKRAQELNANLFFCKSHEYDWYHYLTKIKAIESVAKQFPKQRIVFLDSDTLITKSPEKFNLLSESPTLQAMGDQHESFIAMKPSNREHFWKEISSLCDLDITYKNWPFPYFNAGAFSFPAQSNFAHIALNTITRLLKAKVKHPDFGVHSFDEIALSVAAAQSNLVFEDLGSDYNYSVTPWEKTITPIPEETCILHYHNFQLNETISQFIDLLNKHDINCGSWQIENQGISPFSGQHQLGQIHATIIRAVRTLRRKRHLSHSTYI